MTLKDRKKLAFKVAWRVWGKHPAPARIGKARRLIETLLDDDALLAGVDTEAVTTVVSNEAVRRLKIG